MKVKLKTILAGPEFAGQPGQVLDLPGPTAADLVKGGYAEAMETAEDPAPEEAETAVVRKHKMGRR